MRFSQSFKVLAVALMLSAGVYSPLSYAGDDVAVMAGILLSLQHFPSDANKESLGAIANGEGSDAEKTVANAIAGIQHQVSADDKTALEAIAAEESQPAGIRELAAIVANINHFPGADAKAALMVLAGN